MMRGRTGFVLRVVAALALLAFLLARVDTARVGAALRAADGRMVALAVACYLGAIGSNTLKWGILLRAQGVRAPWAALVRYTFVGLFFNNLLPAAVGGDLMRGYGLAQDTQRRADAAVSVVVDRLVGLLALTSTALASVVVAQAQGAAGGADLSRVFWVAMTAGIALAGGFAVGVSRRARAGVGAGLAGLARRVPLLTPLVGVYGKLADAIGAYRHQPGALGAAWLVGVGTILLANVVNFLLSQALAGPQGLEPISLLHIFIFNPLVGLLQLVPLSVGGLGLNQTAYEGFYHQLLGYDQAHVVALSFLMQFVIYLTSLPGGLLWWRGRGEGEKAKGKRPKAKGQGDGTERPT